LGATAALIVPCNVLVDATDGGGIGRIEPDDAAAGSHNRDLVRDVVIARIRAVVYICHAHYCDPPTVASLLKSLKDAAANGPLGLFGLGVMAPRLVFDVG
jgi:hypothetical protein